MIFTALLMIHLEDKAGTINSFISDKIRYGIMDRPLDLK